MVSKLMILIAALSLIAGGWFALEYMRGELTRPDLLTRLNLVTLVWFVCATVWAYKRPQSG